MSTDRIRLGVIGANAKYGWANRAHIPALLALPEYEVVAVCTSRRETAEESARHYGVPLAFHDFREMVVHPDVDLVTVSVRVPWHYSMVIAALEAGKHVFCEWPLGANLSEAEEMVSLAQSRGVTHMVDLQARAAPPLLHFRKLLAEGYVGEVLACNMTMFLPGILKRGRSVPWMADRTKGANTLTIEGGHSIDALSFCVGEFREVLAQVSTRVPPWETFQPGETVAVTSPDNVLASGVLTNGAVASFHVASVPSHGTGWRMEVYGQEGTLIATSGQMVQYGEIHLQGGRGDGKLLDITVPDQQAPVPDQVPAGPAYNVAQMYRRLSQAIRLSESVEPDFQVAVKRHNMLDAIERSSKEGTKVKVE